MVEIGNVVRVENLNGFYEVVGISTNGEKIYVSTDTLLVDYEVSPEEIIHVYMKTV